jgi:hypothetical protein
MKQQSTWGTVSYEMLRCGQMILRYPLSILGCLAIFFGANAGICVRTLMGGRLMRFLSSISFQFYIWHQYFAVKLRKWGFPPSQSQTPNYDGEVAWQYRFTFCAFGLALLVAIVLTVAFERPIARFGAKKYKEIEAKRREKAARKRRGKQEAVFAHNGFIRRDVARVFAAVKLLFGCCAAGHDGGKREKRRGDDRAEKRMNQRKQRRNDDQQRNRHGKRVPRVDLLVLKGGLHAAVQLFEHAGQLLLKCRHGHIQTERENNGGRQGECAHRIPP